jgi:hypothetical protein
VLAITPHRPVGWYQRFRKKHNASVSRAEDWGSTYHWNAGNLYLPTTLHVSRVTQYSVWLRAGRGSIPGRGERIFPLASVSRPALGPTQPSVQWVPGGACPGGKARPGRDPDHSPHLLPRSRMSRSCTPLPPSAFVVCSGTALAFVISVHGVTAQGTDTGLIIAVRSSGVSQHSVLVNLIVTLCRQQKVERSHVKGFFSNLGWLTVCIQIVA